MFDTQQGHSLVLVTTWFTRYPSGSSTLSPGELLCGVAAVHGELPLLLFLQEACEVQPLQPRQELPPLSQVASVFRVWKLQPSLSESILKKPNCLRFHFNHDISQALESKAFLYVFMAGICDNTALVKGKTFSKYFPPLKVFFFFFLNQSKITQ